MREIRPTFHASGKEIRPTLAVMREIREIRPTFHASATEIRPTLAVMREIRPTFHASGKRAIRAIVPMKAPGTIYFIAKGPLVAASLQLIGPSPCTPAPPSP